MINKQNKQFHFKEWTDLGEDLVATENGFQDSTVID